MYWNIPQCEEIYNLNVNESLPKSSSSSSSFLHISSRSSNTNGDEELLLMKDLF